MLILSYIFAPKLKSDTIIEVQIADTFSINYPLKTVKSKDEFTAFLKIENPTLIYPQFVRINSISTDLQVIRRINDSTYGIEISFAEDATSEVFIEVVCLVLAGNDFTSKISFIQTRINSENFPDISYVVHVKTLNNELPYLRFPTFLRIYPNPLFDRDVVNIEYINDVLGDIDIYLYDALGREYFVKKSINSILGVQVESLELNKNILSGLYQIELRTKFGRISKPIIIIK